MPDQCSSADGKTRMLSPQQSADRSGLSLATIYRYLKSGKLTKHQPGGRNCRVLIAEAELFRAASPSDSEAAEVEAANQSDQPIDASSNTLSGPAPKWTRRA